MKERFENSLDINGARAKANQMAKEFTRMTGIGLKFNHCYIDSPYYGYIDSIKDYPEDDPDSLFVFQFDETDNHYENVSFIPSLNRVMVWRSLNDDNPYFDEEDGGPEGAVNPETGFADWEDELEYASYPLSSWKKYRRPKQ